MADTLRSISVNLDSCYIAIVGPESARLPVLATINHCSDLNRLGFCIEFILERECGKGLYSAINFAISSVSVNWVNLTYINDDDLLGYYFKTVSVLRRKCSSDSFAYGKVRMINEVGASLGYIPTISSAVTFEALLAQGISPLNQQGMIIPRALWEKLGGFRTEYMLCADLDFWLRAHRLGWPFKYYPLEVGQFRIREGQLSGDTHKLEAEIAAVFARDAPRKIGRLEKFYARWQFRIKNLPIYINRFISGRRLRGMKLLAGK
ncbi:MAG: hypothetical protein H2172_13685 [Opitutus sp.]|nr:hypothetical protein [Opitutus sp.]MCS6277667.1 hypothetical protein [Opitutus sp.]MCS6300785.1 hypothetical protein [Opitutus sp.]